MAGEIVTTTFQTCRTSSRDRAPGGRRSSARIRGRGCSRSSRSWRWGWCCGTLGLQFGLPAVYNPDEVAIMARALAFAKGSLNPHNFLYPTLLLLRPVRVGRRVSGGVWVTGGVASLQRPVGAVLHQSDRHLHRRAGRSASRREPRRSASSTASARSIGGSRTAAAAAIFLAVAPLHVRDSHYVKHDVPATLAVVAAYLAMTRIWPGRRAQPGVRTIRRPGATSLLAGAVTGIAFSTHYYCIFLALPLTWAIVLRAWEGRRRDLVWQLAAAAAASAVAFFALSPFLLVEPLTALRDIVANRQIVVDRAVAAGAFGPAAHYAAHAVA